MRHNFTQENNEIFEIQKILTNLKEIRFYENYIIIQSKSCSKVVRKLYRFLISIRVEKQRK